MSFSEGISPVLDRYPELQFSISLAACISIGEGLPLVILESRLLDASRKIKTALQEQIQKELIYQDAIGLDQVGAENE